MEKSLAIVFTFEELCLEVGPGANFYVLRSCLLQVEALPDELTVAHVVAVVVEWNDLVAEAVKNYCPIQQLADVDNFLRVRVDVLIVVTYTFEIVLSINFESQFHD